MQRSTAARIPDRDLLLACCGGRKLTAGPLPARCDDRLAEVAQVGDDQLLAHVLGEQVSQPGLAERGDVMDPAGDGSPTPNSRPSVLESTCTAAPLRCRLPD